MRCFALYSSLTGLWALAANAKPPARPDPQPIELVPTVSTPSNTGITLIVTSFIDDDHTRKLTLSKLTNILTPKQTNDTLSTMGDPPVADSIICSSGPRITNDALTLMIKKLRTREGLPALPAGSCAQVECYFKQGIEWCNESPETMTLPSWWTIIRAAEEMKDTCNPNDYFDKNYLKFSGYAEYTYGPGTWSIIIQKGYKC